ncbi:MAG: outer membrane protein assembly factor BamC [Burkholderiales bacterium]|nr:outer membrane protein assembly factor BamC [Burkholderiales bacterium]
MRRNQPSRLPSLRRSCLAASLGAAFALGGCSSLTDAVQGHDVAYQSAKAGPSLAVPPDLTQLARDQRYTVPEGGKAPQGSISALAYQTTVQQNEQQATSDAVLPRFPGMHIRQSGALRWLVVDAAPSALWDKVQTFWQQNGFYLTETDAQVGVMQTDWAENRAKLPQDFIRKYLGKVFDSVYDTGERDRYRTVFEATPDGKGTEIFISHQTMVEVYSDTQKTQTVWQPGTPDPSLDAVFLRKLMVSLGASDQQAKAQLAQAQQQARQAPQATLVDNGRALQLPDDQEQAWRRVSLALNSAGFTVTGRNRSAGQFDVRYVNPEAALKAEQDSGGFFSKLFGGKKAEAPPQNLRIAVESAGSGSKVTVHSLDGGADAAASEANILKVLLQQLQ